MKEMLRVDEVADLLRCSQMTVRRMLKDGKLPAFRPHRGYLIPAEAVQKLLDKAKVKNE